MNSSNPVITIRKYTKADKNNWDYYVIQHSQGTLYHLSGWKNVIEKTYGHNSLYLMAMQQPEPGNQQLVTRNSQAVTRNRQLATRNPQPNCRHLALGSFKTLPFRKHPGLHAFF
jgi:hypothetical protein